MPQYASPLKGSTIFSQPTCNTHNPTCTPLHPLPAEHFKLEASSQRGTQVLAGTFEGARSASGSGSSYNLARRDSLGGAASAHNNDAYGPTAGRATVVGADRRSVAFTDIAPNSAASAGTGYGVVASAAGEHSNGGLLLWWCCACCSVWAQLKPFVRCPQDSAFVGHCTKTTK